MNEEYEAEFWTAEWLERFLSHVLAESKLRDDVLNYFNVVAFLNKARS